MSAGARSPERHIRVASGQGFWGDELDAPLRQVQGGPIDYLMLDYLAEVTMSILRKQLAKDPRAGYARDFVALMERIFPACIERGIRVVSNAAGVNPLGCVDALVEAGRGAGVGGRAKVGLVTGDDLMDRLDELLAAGHELQHMESGRPLSDVRDVVQSANAYLGAAPIVEALRRGADVALTGRTIDAALTYAPLVYEFDWPMDDYDLLAAGVVAGHINECGAQCTGGNCLIDWWKIPDLANVGFPIVEASPDGTFVVTKHDGTGGWVTRASVTEQLLYEIGDPAKYLGPDVAADFTSVELVDDGPDRVRVQGVRGGPPPEKLKVSVAYAAGWKSVGTLTYAWPDAPAKARAADKVLRERLDRLGLRFEEIHTELVGWTSTHGALAGEPDPDTPEVQLRFAVRAGERAPLERFTREIAPLVLTGPPSVTGYATGRPRVDEIVAFWPALIDRSAVEPHVRVEIRDV
jgi:hypothetical protein